MSIYSKEEKEGMSVISKSRHKCDRKHNPVSWTYQGNKKMKPVCSV